MLSTSRQIMAISHRSAEDLERLKKSVVGQGLLEDADGIESVEEHSCPAPE